MQFELLEDVAQRYGEPFYILDLERFAGNLERFLAAFNAHYSTTRVAY
jgi:diaminopimelate decarboxylase